MSLLSGFLLRWDVGFVRGFMALANAGLAYVR